MARTIGGLHFENKGFSWDWELGHEIAAPNGGIVMLDTLLTDVENEFWYPKIRRLHPEQIICIRMYPECGWPDINESRHWIELDPKVWAAECLRRLTARGFPILDDPLVLITPANEQDLAGEGHPRAATWTQPNVPEDVHREIDRWNLAWATEFRRLAAGMRCGLLYPARAGGHEPVNKPPDWEYTTVEFQEALAAYDALGVHAYFHPSGWGTRPDNDGYWYGIRCLRPKGYRESVQKLPPVGGIGDPGGVVTQHRKPFVVKEFGNFRHYNSSAESVSITLQGYRECYSAYSASGLCLFVAPFLWNSGDEHRENRIRGNEPLRRGLTDLRGQYTACDWPYKPGGGETVDRIEALLTDMWARQGVRPAKGADAFWAYALTQARQGRIIVPQVSRDGNYYNSDDPKYVVAYTLPVPLWCEKNVWVVHEGFPPF